jgi:hypothetical protein
MILLPSSRWLKKLLTLIGWLLLTEGWEADFIYFVTLIKRLPSSFTVWFFLIVYAIDDPLYIALLGNCLRVDTSGLSNFDLRSDPFYKVMDMIGLAQSYSFLVFARSVPTILFKGFFNVSTGKSNI